jgi:transcriptional regulator with XRE-family HTH domain
MKPNTENSPHLGRNIAAIRSIKRIKQATFASALGISQQAVSKMEKSADISHERLLHVAEVLKTTVSVIEAFDEENVIGG